MTYLRPYVNKMLENQPYGDTFKEIWDLARCVEAYVPPIPDPEDEEQTRAQKILYSILKFILRIIELSFLSSLSGGSVRIKSRSDIRRENLPKYYEQLHQKLTELMNVLDCSKDTIWLATYMVEEGVTVCPYAMSVFEEYLEKCELNPWWRPLQLPSHPEGSRPFSAHSACCFSAFQSVRSVWRAGMDRFIMQGDLQDMPGKG